MSSKKENETKKGEKKTPQKRGGEKHTHTIQNKTKNNFRIIIMIQINQILKSLPTLDLVTRTTFQELLLTPFNVHEILGFEILSSEKHFFKSVY